MCTCFDDHMLLCLHALMFTCFYVHIFLWSFAPLSTCFDDHMLPFLQALTRTSPPTCTPWCSYAWTLYDCMLLCSHTLLITCFYVHMCTCFDDHILLCLHALMFTCFYVHMFRWLFAPLSTCFDDCMLPCLQALMRTSPPACTPWCSYTWTLLWLHAPMFTCFVDHMLLCSHASMLVCSLVYIIFFITYPLAYMPSSSYAWIH